VITAHSKGKGTSCETKHFPQSDRCLGGISVCRNCGANTYNNLSTSAASINHNHNASTHIRDDAGVHINYAAISHSHCRKVAGSKT
jgi:hypothetical protein